MFVFLRLNGFQTATEDFLPFQITVELVTERMDAAPVCVSVERVSGSVCTVCKRQGERRKYIYIILWFIILSFWNMSETQKFGVVLYKASSIRLKMIIATETCRRPEQHGGHVTSTDNKHAVLLV